MSNFGNLYEKKDSFKKRPSRARLTVEEERWFYVLVGPWVLGFSIFGLGPILFSLYMSLTKWDILGKPQWVGLGNYFQLFFRDLLFRKVLFNTAYYSFASVPLCIGGAVFLAVLLNQKIPMVRLFRTLCYTPAVVSGVAVAILWGWLLNPEFGLVNSLLRNIGVEGPRWFTDPRWAMPSLIMMSLWGIGGATVIFLAGLQGIPAELYEAAAIDGATPVRRFFAITLPMLSPVIFFNLITGLIGSFQIFTQSYVITRGGPENATRTIVLYLYNKAFEDFSMGYGSAIAWVLFIICLILTLVVLSTAKFWVYYEGQMGTGKR